MYRLSKFTRLFALALILAALAGCGGSNTTPTPDLVGTMVAGTYQAMTAAAPPPTPQPTMTLPPPPTTPTQAPPPATRINFATGSTYGSAAVTLQPGQSQAFVLGARQGQPLITRVDSAYSDGILTIRGADNTELLSAALRYTSWWGILPSTQDYIITVTAGTAGGTYTLGVTIAARISFAPGATSATVSGTTVGGYNVSYVAWAAAGQTMTVTLNAAAGAAALEIWGFSDSQLYVNHQDGWTSYYMTMSIAQDFIIEVYPIAGGAVNYTLTVEIH